jgi:ankyrin repeat protein
VPKFSDIELILNTHSTEIDVTQSIKLRRYFSEILSSSRDQLTNEQKLEYLNYAIVNKHTDIVSQLLDNSVELNTLDGQQFLLTAALKGYSEIFSLLLNHCLTIGVTLNEQDVQIILEQAAINGQIELVKLWQDRIAAIDKQEAQKLIQKGTQGDTDIVSQFLDKSVQCNELDGQQFLLNAVFKGYSEIFSLLLNHCLTIGVTLNEQYLQHSLQQAVITEQTKLVNLLQDRIAAIDNKELLNKVTHGDTKGVALLLEHGAAINEQDHYGNTPIIYAVTFGYTDIAKMLLNYRVEPDNRDEYLNTLLVRAIHYRQAEIVELLLDSGAKIDYQDQTYGLTPLINAVMFGHDDIVKILLDRGANIDIKDKKDKTALMHAQAKNHNNIVVMFNKPIDNQLIAVKNTSQPNKQTIAYFALALLSSIAIAAIGVLVINAVMFGHDDIVKILPDRGANIDIEDEKALMHAQAKNHNNIVVMFNKPIDNQLIAYFALALLSSIAIAAIGVLALFGLSCYLVVCLVVAVISCISLFGFINSLAKKKPQTPETATQNATVITSKPDKSILHSVLNGLISLIPAACVVFHMFSVLCPPLLLVAIGMMSSILLVIHQFPLKVSVQGARSQLSKVDL